MLLFLEFCSLYETKFRNKDKISFSRVKILFLTSLKGLRVRRLRSWGNGDLKNWIFGKDLFLKEMHKMAQSGPPQH